MKLIYVFIHVVLPIVNCDTCSLVENEGVAGYKLSISSINTKYTPSNAFDKNIMTFVQTDCSTKRSKSDCKGDDTLQFLDNYYHWFLIALDDSKSVFNLLKSVIIKPARPTGTEKCVFPWRYEKTAAQFSCGDPDNSKFNWCSHNSQHKIGEWSKCSSMIPDGTRTNDIEVLIASEMSNVPDVSLGYRNINWTTFELCGKTNNNYLNADRTVECAFLKHSKYVALRRGQRSSNDPLCCLEFAEITLQMYKGSQIKVSKNIWIENSKTREFIDSGCEFPTSYGMTIQWYFINFLNETKLLNITQTKYEINNPNRYNAGRYYYEYLNWNGKVIYQSDATNYINVKHKIGLLKLQSSQNFIFVENVSSIDITCKTDSGFPFPSGRIQLIEITSSLNNSSVNEFGGRSIEIYLNTKAERRFHNKTVTCLVKQDDLETKRESVIQILWSGELNNITFSPELPMEGDDIDISCGISDYGNPKVEILIEKVGGESFNQTTLLLPNIQANQSGNYGCRMSNSVAQFLVTRILNIAFVRWKIMPIIRVKKRINETQVFNISSILTDFYPNNFNLSCWRNSILIRKKEFLTSDQLNFELHLSNANFSGNYRCFVDHIYFRSRKLTGAEYLVDIYISTTDTDSPSYLSWVIGLGIAFCLSLILLLVSVVFIRSRKISTVTEKAELSSNNALSTNENDTDLHYIGIKRSDNPPTNDGVFTDQLIGKEEDNYRVTYNEFTEFDSSNVYYNEN